MRLDKYLADMKKGTRSEVKDAIRKGRVSVNGKPVRDPSLHVNETDDILFDGEIISYVSLECILLNKPAGYLSATDDPRYPTVMDLIDSRRKDLFPIGRLDIDTEGLLLLSNDGALAHDLLSPKKHVVKTYYVQTDRDIPESVVPEMEGGMDLGDFVTLPAKLEILSGREALLSIQEGKFHQVKRMFEKTGCTVTYLKRISFGPLTLGDLETGCSRPLTEAEIDALKKAGR